MQYTYFVPRTTTKLTTRGGTSPDGAEMTLIREMKSTHRLGTRLRVESSIITQVIELLMIANMMNSPVLGDKCHWCTSMAINFG